MSQMDKEELSRHDGSEEGRKTYVAYEGKIYDVSESKLWRKGVHVKAHKAGNDLTKAMTAAPHGPEVMERYGVVAELVEGKSEKSSSGFREAPPWAQRILDEHPHPISVHFPIALCLVAAIFTGLGIMMNIPSLERAASYNLAFAALTTPPAIATGVLSWYYNYNSVWTHIYRMKVFLSILLVILLSTICVLYFFFPVEPGGKGVWYWIYSALVVASAPTVVGLGYYGGKITFPS